MKCEVESCEYNKNNTCDNIENLIISECGEGVYCSTYKQSIQSKREQYQILEYNDNNKYKKVIVFMPIHLRLSICWDAIKLDAQNYNTQDCLIVIDLTLSTGIKSSNRYLSLLSCGDIKEIYKTDNYSEDLLQYLKTKTCEHLRKNEELLENSILNSAHVKMIKKGIVI